MQLLEENATGEVKAPSFADPEEKNAITNVLLGQINEFEFIMRRYNQRLFRTARSILKDNDAAQDAVQEAYISAFLRLDRYTANGSFAAWLTRITINEALMIKRKPDNRIADKPDTNDCDELQTSQSGPENQTANKELRDLLETAIDQLPDNFRTVFLLRAVQELSVYETAQCLDIPEATVKTRFHRARHLMQQQLDAWLNKEEKQAFEFAGARCDRIVRNVLARLFKLQQQITHYRKTNQPTEVQ